MKRISVITSIIFVLLLSGCGELSSEEQEAAFVRAVDGDTLIANIDGTEEYVRLLLVDTPETKHPKRSVQPFGPEASQLMKTTFSPSDPIEIEYGTEKRDKYDRILAYIYTEDGQLYNEMLLKEGLARVAYVYPPNDKYVERFRDIEAEAQEKKLGIWSIEGYVTERGFNSDAVHTSQSDTYDGMIPYDPFGPDRDCSDFDSQVQAQAFYEAAGGPEKDPHRLDGNNDRIVCEGL